LLASVTSIGRRPSFIPSSRACAKPAKTRWPLAARAQQAGKIRMIGILSAGSASVLSAVVFPDALRELGWIEGQNVVIERRHAENRVERLPELAAELSPADRNHSTAS
jgi:hypothetical protein